MEMEAQGWRRLADRAVDGNLVANLATTTSKIVHHLLPITSAKKELRLCIMSTRNGHQLQFAARFDGKYRLPALRDYIAQLITSTKVGVIPLFHR